MKSLSLLTRRALMAGVALTAALAAGAAAAQEQYPNRPIRLIQGFAAGSTMDIYARFFANKLEPLIGGTIIADPRPGADGMIATEAIVRSAPDGYTVFMGSTSSTATVIHLWENPPVNGVTDLDFISMVNRQALMIVVDPKGPIKTLPELTALLKQKGKSGSYGYGGSNGLIYGALYRSIAKLETVDVPYRVQAQGYTDLLGGQLDAYMSDGATAMMEAANGRVRTLAVSVGTRLSMAPQIPTMIESGVPGLDLPSHVLLAAPKGTPKAILDKWANALRTVEQSEDTKKFLIEYGAEPYPTTPEEATAIMRKMQTDWAHYADLAKIQKRK